jgi:hypothetical protein
MWAKLAKKTLNIRGKYALMLLCFLLLAHPAAAVRVAVVIDTPGQLIAKCVTTSPDANAYAIMQQTGQNIAWAYYGQALGHGLCSITGIGCPSSNCYCDPDSYWNFYAKEAGGEWTYSAVGFDGGTSCAEHYCAEEGEMLGFAYGSYGTAPAGYTFGEHAGRWRALRERIARGGNRLHKQLDGRQCRAGGCYSADKRVDHILGDLFAPAPMHHL